MRGEVTLADIYHAMGGTSVACIGKAIWFGRIDPSRGGYLSTVSDGWFPQNNPNVPTLSELLWDANRVLQETESGVVNICCFARDTPKLGTIFSSSRLFSLSAYNEPQLWFVMLIANFLLYSGHIDEVFLEKILSQHLGNRRCTKRAYFRLPSQLTPQDPTMHYVYSWPSIPLPYNAFHFYTERPYLSKVPKEKLELYSRRVEPTSFKVTVCAESAASLKSFNLSLRKRFSALQREIADNSLVVWAPEHSAHQVMLAFHEQMNHECLELVEEAFRMATDIALHARSHPGRSKYLFLILLQDYLNEARESLQSAKERLQHLQQETPQSFFEERRNEIIVDIDYIFGALDRATAHIDSCRAGCKIFQEIKQSQIAGIMSFLVAIYVPLAFVSSYFGMNTVEFRSHRFSNTLFWQIAIPLMLLTIMMPLSLTIMARITRGLSLSAAAFSLRQWPMLVDIAISLYCVGLLVAHIVHWRTSADRDFVVFFQLISPHETTIADSVLVCLCALKTLEQSTLRNRRGRLWFHTYLSITIVCIACTGFSALDDTCATLLAPLIFMLVVLAIRPLFF